MTNHFLVNPDDGTINLHYDSLNPAQVAALISKLQANLRLLKMRQTDPIQVLRQSVRLDRASQQITFHLDWNAPMLTIDLNSDQNDDCEEDVLIPKPNVELTPEQNEIYLSTLLTMIKGV